MLMIRVRTIRAHKQWVKITRDRGAKRFTLARGEQGEVKAKQVGSYPFDFMPTWGDAIEHAKYLMDANKDD